MLAFTTVKYQAQTLSWEICSNSNAKLNQYLQNSLWKELWENNNLLTVPLKISHLFFLSFVLREASLYIIFSIAILEWNNTIINVG